MRKKSHSVCHRHRDVSPVFFLIFHHKRELRESYEAVNTRRETARKKNLWSLWTSISLGSGPDPQARVRWYFYKHANRYDWSVWPAIPRARWGYLLLHFLGNNFVCKMLQFSVYINVQDSSVSYIHFVSDGAFEEIWPLYSWGVFQRLKVSMNIKALLAVINRKDMFAILPTEHRK